MEADRPLTMSQTAKRYPDGTSVETVIRHVTRGIKTPSGTVKLEAWKVGGRWATTETALHEFWDRLTVESRKKVSPPVAARRSHLLAVAHLKSLGF